MLANNNPIVFECEDLSRWYDPASMTRNPGTPGEKLLAFDPSRSRRRTAGPGGSREVGRREPLPERIACVLIGSAIAFGFGTVTYLFLTQPSPAIWISGLVVAIPLSFIGIFGLSWVIQGLHGRSRHEGLFYWLLGRVVGVGPRPWAPFLPVLSLAGVLAGSLTGDPAGLEYALRMLLFWLVLMSHIAVHELGHVVAAAIARLPVRRVIVGPFEFVRTSGWRLELCREWLSICGGFVALSPEAAAPRPWKLLVFVLGGPMATLMLLALFLVASPFDLLTLAGASGPLQKSVFSAGVWLGVFALVVNLWPARQLVLGSPSDGYQILAAMSAMRRNRRAIGASARSGGSSR